jgi:hypothetical protein
MRKKKCCIRNSRNRVCTKKNMCPRKRCKTQQIPVPVPVPKQVPASVQVPVPVPVTKQVPASVQTSEPEPVPVPVPASVQTSEPEPEQVSEQDNCNKQIQELSEIFNKVLDGVSNENKYTIEKLYKKIEQKNSELNDLKWKVLHKGTGIKDYEQKIDLLNKDYKVFIKKIKLIYNYKIKGLETTIKDLNAKTKDLEQQKLRTDSNYSLQKILLTESSNKNKVLFEQKQLLERRIVLLQTSLGNLAKASRARVNELLEELSDLKKYINLYKSTVEYKDWQLNNRFGSSCLELRYLQRL